MLPRNSPLRVRNAREKPLGNAREKLPAQGGECSREMTENGTTHIRAHVVKVEGSQVTIKLQGSSPTTSAVSGPEEEIAADAVEG